MPKYQRARSAVLTVVAVFVAAGAFAAGTQEMTGAESEPAELVHYIQHAGDVSDGPQVYEVLNEVLLDRINARVDIIDVPGGEYNQKIQVVINSGEQYDVCFTSNWMNNYHQNVAKGAFSDLTDLLPRHAPNLYERLREYFRAAMINGRIYAVLNEQFFAMARLTNIPHNLADAANLDVEEYSRRALAGENIYELDYEMRNMLAEQADDDTVFAHVGMAVALDYHLIDTPIDARVPGAVRVEDTDLTVFNQFDSDLFRELLDYNQRLLEEGLITNIDLLNQPGGYRKLRASGDVVQPVHASGTYKPGGEQEEAMRYQYLYYQEPMSTPMVKTNSIIATMLACSSTSRDPAKVVEYFEAINTPEVYMLLHYGLEGEHYEVTNDGFLSQFEGTSYMRGVPWACGSAFLSPPLIGQPADVWEQSREMRDNALKSPLLGFAFDATAVQAEIGQARSVYKEYVNSLLQGKRPVTDYEEMLVKFRAAGSQRIIEELQLQIDQWLASR